MRRLTDLLVYLPAAAAGHYIPAIIMLLAVKFSFVPHFADKSPATQAFVSLFQIAQLVWLAGAAIGIAGFFAQKRETKLWLLLLPAYLPGFYTVLVFVYYNFLPKT